MPRKTIKRGEVVAFYNPTDKPVEFLFNNREYVVKPHKVRHFNWDIARHIDGYVKTPLVIYEEGMEKRDARALELEKMKIGALKKKAAELGVFQTPTMKKTEIIEAIVKAEKEGAKEVKEPEETKES